VETCDGANAQAAPAPQVRVTEDADGARVELVAPAEPLAWAIDVQHDPHAAFRTAWHSERAPGMRARAAERVARLGPVQGPIAVRVWSDDGGVATLVPGAT
jgi:hypothetical protein